MHKDELREKIADVLAIIDGDTDKPIVKERIVRYALTDTILALIDPELAKAEKWDRVVEMANTFPLCKCPLWDDDKRECTSEYVGCVFNDVVDALEKEST